MFGLMKAKKCGMPDAEKHFRRLNYCGTCKTLGSLYGQKSRLLLNHDTVFLAEILTALSGESVLNWQKSYQSFNCLNLPKKEMPAALQFAATANLILTEFKLADHISDEGKSRYKFAQKSFTKEFKKARNLLKDWDFPLEKVKTVLHSQNEREIEVRGKDSHEILENLALPTAETTAIFFAEGAGQIGKREFANPLRLLGFAFGKLIYLLDAFEDYEKDFQTNQFNAIRAAFKLEESKIPVDVKRKIISTLSELELEITDKICKLPLTENQKKIFSSRLSQNLQRKLKTNLPVIHAKKVCDPKQNFAQRWQKSVETAQNMTRGLSWQMPLGFLFVLIFALVAPAQTREAKSARECFDLSFNLMFIGAIFGSVLTVPVLAMQKLSPEQIAQKAEKKQREGWCDDCDCDCCCCDCDGCNCGNGCCDNCCCDGCCDCSCD